MFETIFLWIGAIAVWASVFLIIGLPVEATAEKYFDDDRRVEQMKGAFVLLYVGCTIVTAVVLF